MKVAGYTATILAAMISLSQAAAQPQVDLAVALRLTQAEYTGDSPIILEFKVTNPSDQPVTFLTWHTPLEGINSDMFTVTVDGRPVEYIGRLVNRSAPQPEDYITLEPGATASARIDLRGGYDLSTAGNYKVEFTAELFDARHRATRLAGAEQPNLLADEEMRSNSGSFRLLQGVPQPLAPVLDAEQSELTAPKLPTFKNCNQSQQYALIDATIQAEKITLESIRLLERLTSTEQPNAQRYTTWFGTHTATRYNTVKDNFKNIHDTLTTKALVFSCDATCNPSFIAVTLPTAPFEIKVCNAFWPLPMLGTKSKAGSVVHELTHFTVVAGTTDSAYGQKLCKQLAIDAPDKAVANADSHEYFAENTPLPMEPWSRAQTPAGTFLLPDWLALDPLGK